jgi:uncharacterized protein (DUF736 family)
LIALGLLIAIEAAMDAARAQTRRLTMATIGTFTKSENGFSGQIKTVTLNVKAKFAPAEKENDKAPDYRIFGGQTELGAAWKKTSNAGREYLSVKLDDPTFPAPIFASLVAVEGGDGYALIWSRRSGDFTRRSALQRGGAPFCAGASRPVVDPAGPTSFEISASVTSHFRAILLHWAPPARRESPRARSRGDTMSPPSDCAGPARAR